MLPVVALIGRPNVGKSTLFNRLIRKRKAITHDRPGVTRDRVQGEGSFSGRRAAVVDTGGMDFDSEDHLDKEVLAQARAAVDQADLLLLVADAREGLNPLDEQVATLLRGSGKTVFLAVNKVDGPDKEDLLLSEFHALGFPLAAVSAEHGFGLNRLREIIAELLPEREAAEAPRTDEESGDAAGDEAGPEAAKAKETPLRLAMLGRPNAGKSSLVNALVGEKRLIVSETAGTTRDAVDVAFVRGGRRYVFVDTAGVRKRARIDDGVEKFSVQRALDSAKKADVAVLVVDATGGLGVQDKKLIAFLDREKIAFVTAVNKVDLLRPAELAELKKDLAHALRICSHAPVLYVSALTGRGLAEIVRMAGTVRRECSLRVGTGELNRAMRAVLENHQAPMVNGRRAKFYYLTQSEETPPTFVFFVNDPDLVKPSYAAYLENGLRKMFRIKHAPIRLHFRSSHKPKE